MFRKIGLLLSLSLLFGFAAAAQDSKADAYLGYQYTRQTYGTGNSFNMNGGVGQIAVYPSSWLGIVAEFSGSTVSSSTGLPASGVLYSYMGGPRLSFRHGPLQPYVQGLFGLSHLNPTLQGSLASTSANAYSMAVGGGLDLKVSRRFAVRLIQGDYFLTRFNNPLNARFSQNNFRLSSGLVFRF